MNTLKSPVVSIITPTYKEALNIPVLAEKIDSVMSDASLTYELIVVDDDSQDGTVEAFENIKDRFNIRLKVRTDERGLASAVIAGFEMATGQYCVVMDADLSHPPEKIPELINSLQEGGSDFVIGSRFVDGGSAAHFNILRRLNAWGSKTLARPFTKATDPMAGFFAFPRNILRDDVVLSPIGFKIGLEVMVKCEPKTISEVPIAFQERLHGDSKLSLKEQVNYLRHLKRLSDYKYPAITQFLVFSIIGCLGMVVDLLTVFITKEVAGLPFRIARIAGFVLALSVNFMMNRTFTFPDADEGNAYRQYVSFFAVCLCGFAVNWLLSVYLVENVTLFMGGYFYLLAAFIGILGGLVVNFTGSKFLVFRRKN